MDNPKLTAIFDKLRNRLEQSLNDLPRHIGNSAVNYSLDAFKNEAWEGKPWAKRKSKKDAGRKLLIGPAGGGALRRSIDITYIGPGRVKWGSKGIVYAQVHNDGLTITRQARSETFVRNRYKRGPKSKYFGGMGAFSKGTTPGQGLSFKSYSYRMTQRQFLGDTPKLRAHLRQVAADKLRNDLKNL